MDAEQNLVVDFDKGAAAVLAGAGSGKTSTLIGRIKQLSEKVDPKRIVMLTFTNSAADEMKERASQVNEACSDVIACTYHKYCGKMLRTFPSQVKVRFVVGSNHIDKIYPSQFRVEADYQEIENSTSDKCTLHLVAKPPLVIRASLEIEQVDYLIERL